MFFTGVLVPKGRKGLRKLAALLGGWVIAVFLLSVTLPDGVASAQENRLWLSTDFTGITVKRGEAVNLRIQLHNRGLPPQDVELSIVSGPEGWNPVLKGLDFIIHRALVDTDDREYFYFNVRVPDDVKTGDYTFLLKAQSGGITDTLPIELRVREVMAQSTRLVTQYPVLRGPAKATFQFRLDLSNDGFSEQTYTLGAAAPEGWEVAFHPSYEDKQITSLSLKAGDSKGLEVEVTPPRDVTAGEYPITVEASSGGDRATVDLKVVITGSYEILVTTPSGRLNADAEAGRESPVTLLVKNTGSATLRDINFSSTKPSNWSVTFKPEALEELPAGAEREVTAFIKPSSKAIAGDYVVSVRASNRQASDWAEFRVTVHTPTLWGWIGVGIVFIVVAGVLWVFRTYGRR